MKKITVNFGEGMSHIKQIVGEKLMLENSGYTYDKSETDIIHINDVLKTEAFINSSKI